MCLSENVKLYAKSRTRSKPVGKKIPGRMATRGNAEQNLDNAP